MSLRMFFIGYQDAIDGFARNSSDPSYRAGYNQGMQDHAQRRVRPGFVR